MFSSCPVCWHRCGFVSADATACVWRLGSGNAENCPCLCSSCICAHWAPSTACLIQSLCWKLFKPVMSFKHCWLPQGSTVWICVHTHLSEFFASGFLIGNKTWFLKSKNKSCRQVSLGEHSPKELGLEWLGMTFYWKKERMKVFRSKRSYLLRT